MTQIVKLCSYMLMAGALSFVIVCMSHAKSGQESYVLHGKTYSLEKPLSHGDLQSVYLATRAEDGKRVVLKIAADPVDFNFVHALPNMRILRLIKEGGRRAGNFVFPIDWGPAYQPGSGVTMYVSVLEYSEWPTLIDESGVMNHDFLTEGQQLDLNTSLRNLRRIKGLALELVESVLYLAKRNMVVGDIKPPNILVNAKGDEVEIKLFDYDGAQSIGSRQVIRMSENYYPSNYIENLSTYGVQPIEDIYSIGATVGVLLGRFSPDSAAQRHEEVKQLNVELANFFVVATSQVTEGRYQRFLAFNETYQWVDGQDIAEYLAPRQIPTTFQSIMHVYRTMCSDVKDMILSSW